MSENDVAATPQNEKRNKYNRLVRQAQLLSLLLEDLDFHVAPQALTVDKDTLRRSVGSEVVNFTFDPEEDYCVANIKWTLSVKDKRKSMVRCSAVYSVIYENIKDCDEVAAKIFMDNIGTAATYAYFRALFAHLDWGSGLHSPPLPALRLEPKV